MLEVTTWERGRVQRSPVEGAREQVAWEGAGGFGLLHLEAAAENRQHGGVRPHHWARQEEKFADPVPTGCQAGRVCGPGGAWVIQGRVSPFWAGRLLRAGEGARLAELIGFVSPTRRDHQGERSQSIFRNIQKAKRR